LYQNNFIVDFFKDEQDYNRAFIAKLTNMRYDKK
ncbi:TPA: peptide chain release factor N(5)-glutamine methyltransferase, partial [Campylobacter jejuni]